MVLSRQGPFRHEMGTLQYPSAPYSSPSCFLFLHSSMSGMHEWEAPGWVKRGRRKDQDWLESCQSPISHQETPKLLRRGISPSNFLKYKDALVNTLYCHYCLSASSQCPKFWERYLIAFPCSNHHIRSPTRKRPDKINARPRHLH